MSFEVVDTLGGFATLARRSPTLDGSVPLRVAQACVPLLEGNAWGLQVTLGTRTELARRRGRWSVTSFEGGAERAAMLRGGLPMLSLSPAGRARLAAGLLVTGRRLSLFTGLLVRPLPGHRLRLSSTANRRSLAYEVVDTSYDDTTGLVPLVLDLTPAPDVDRITLHGEVATLGVVPAALRVTHRALGDALDLVRAHVAFYDAAYFATKKGGQVARKYRDEMKASHHATSAASAIDVTIVDGGPRLVELASPPRALRTTGEVTTGLAPDRLVVRSAVTFSATYDGANVIVEPDPTQLERYAADIRARWAEHAAHPGALLYLAKYVTPHPPGEPHFFTKPPALVATPPGTSTLVAGVNGAGYDVMRGVVRTDAFHAVPSVFHLWQPHRTIHVKQGEVVAELFPFARTDEAPPSVERAGAAAI